MLGNKTDIAMRQSKSAQTPPPKYLILDRVRPGSCARRSRDSGEGSSYELTVYILDVMFPAVTVKLSDPYRKGYMKLTLVSGVLPKPRPIGFVHKGRPVKPA